MAITFPDLRTETDVKALDELLSGKTYISGDQITEDDIKVFSAMPKNGRTLRRGSRMLGFKKVDPDNWEFANEGFLRGKKHLLKTIVRKKPTSAHNQPHHPQTQNNSVGACVEVGKFGLEEEIERLKRDKNVLMQELVRLRQQQQSTDHQLQTLGKQLQGMEQRQQQMVSFLAKAMQSPGFFAQFVKQNDSNRRISAGSKKRRLPRQDDESTSPDVQIIKYQPLINEAAKAMLRQIVKDASPRLESFNNSDNFLLENVPSSLETLDSRSISTSNSGVTLSEVPTSSAAQNPPTSSAFSFSHSSSAASEIQSPAGLTDMDTSEIPGISMLSGVLDAVSSSQSAICIPEFAQIPGMVPNSNHADFPVKNYGVPESGSVADGPISIEAGFLDTDLDFSIDEGNELPGINDVFWEQFLTGPMSGDADEADSTTLEVDDVQLELENGNNNSEKMQSLTEQMGLLVSGAER